MAGGSEENAVRSEALDDLVDALRTFTVESDVFVDVFARAHGLGRSHLNAIMWISASAQAGHPMTAGELAGRLGLGAPATTALIDRLESAGHVVRDRDPHDRRKVTIRMQNVALQLAMQFFAPLGVGMAHASADIPVTELKIASTVVRRMTQAVTDARRATARPEATDGSASAPEVP
ncbi:DNA-binding MarR family transcriptional regulator [Allocatelliglobosispora scoriae]|uniref:DNA-binding MarR family transcriptional regulator n=1 Tax=Allocatelliglobosispora scoriae TaxID=643052 RepID=A0A841C3A3_9ACTN|nr:MarR family transcriptional regulator [Allocatelliglobosispora scoriae]MBB5873430.1 DNA-binding MarR family transcriptional regulator [Allocatelliglobosispora scoriae]